MDYLKKRMNTLEQSMQMLQRRVAVKRHIYMRLLFGAKKNQFAQGDTQPEGVNQGMDECVDLSKLPWKVISREGHALSPCSTTMKINGSKKYKVTYSFFISEIKQHKDAPIGQRHWVSILVTHSKVACMPSKECVAYQEVHTGPNTLCAIVDCRRNHMNAGDVITIRHISEKHNSHHVLSSGSVIIEEIF